MNKTTPQNDKTTEKVYHDIKYHTPHMVNSLMEMDNTALEGGGNVKYYNTYEVEMRRTIYVVYGYTSNIQVNR